MSTARPRMAVPTTNVLLPQSKVPLWDVTTITTGRKRYVSMMEVWDLDPETNRIDVGEWYGVPFARDVRREDSFVGIVSLIFSEFNKKRAGEIRKELGAEITPKGLGRWWKRHSYPSERLWTDQDTADFRTTSDRRIFWSGKGLYVGFGPEGSFNLLCRLIEILGFPEELLTDPTCGSRFLYFEANRESNQVVIGRALEGAMNGIHGIFHDPDYHWGYLEIPSDQFENAEAYLLSYCKVRECAEEEAKQFVT